MTKMNDEWSASRNEEDHSVNVSQVDEKYFSENYDKNQPMQLKVRDKNLTVNLDTLTSVKGSILSELFSDANQLPAELDNDGESFKIDRDPVVFE